MIKKVIHAVLLLSCFAFPPRPTKAYLIYDRHSEGRKGDYDSACREYKRTMLLGPQSVFVYKQALNQPCI